MPRIELIPSELQRGDVSRAERKVFNVFKDPPRDLEDGWIVLQSLEIRDERLDGNGWRRRKPELDFVILAPEYGVVCLEVKGGTCRDVHGTCYRWDAVNVPGNQTPFKQASENMSILLSRLNSTFKDDAYDVDKLPIFHAVLLADIEAHVTQVGPCTLFDRRHLRDKGQSLIEGIKAEFEERWRRNDYRREAPNASEVRNIADALLPGWTQMYPLHTIGRELDDLTQAQYQKLEHTVICNLEDRWIFAGRAGVGKTRIALECARRVVTEQPEWKVGLVCPSERTAAYLRHKIQADGHDIEIMCSGHGTWSVGDYELDYLIIDDVQEICDPFQLSRIDRLLKRGLGLGRWAMFGDGSLADGVILHTHDGVQVDLLESLNSYLDGMLPHISRAPLRVHCRNTNEIAQSALECLPQQFVAEPYREHEEAVVGREPRYEYWHDHDDLCGRLGDAVQRLRAEISELRHTDLVILSTRDISNTGLDLQREYGGWPLVSAYDGPPSTLGHEEALYFHTVDSFSGIKSNAVILILAELDSDRDWWQAYLGMSRARGDLVVLGHETLHPHLQPDDFDLSD